MRQWAIKAYNKDGAYSTLLFDVIYSDIEEAKKKVDILNDW